MLKKIYKLIFSILFTVFSVSGGFSFAGIDESIKNSSGEYVYYRDSSFERESYVGFLFYDEGTISVRYYAPAVRNSKPLKPSKDVEILFSLNKEKDFVELTGEKIISSVTAEDTDLINYLHDLIYELGARRKKAGKILEKTVLKQKFDQFGGIVSIEFDPLIPFFNIRGITDFSGKKAFTLVTVGQLASNKDRSFSEFFGFSRDDENTKKLRLNKKAKTFETEYEGKKITLDDQWIQSMDNLWLLGDDAILTMNIFDLPGEDYWNRLCRKLTLGTENSYPKSEMQSVKNTVTVDPKGSVQIFKIDNVFYQPVTGTLTRDFKILTRTADNKIRYFALTVFNHAYLGNEIYFNRIIDSYK